MTVDAIMAARAETPREICPQPGSQWRFMCTAADIAVYGGAAGAGKSFALLMEPLRNIHIDGFGAVLFRRTYPQITNEGGLWHTSQQLYRYASGTPRESTLEWIFPNGNRIKFAHMQHEKDRYEWDGAQIPLIMFDQLEHFTWRQFFYMLSRNRSTCGITPYIRASCNPNPDHWLRDFMRWWIDDETGLPILERSGVVRWFLARGDEIFWADHRDDLLQSYGEGVRPLSFTFIPARIEDNAILLKGNPEYLANLDALPRVDRERLRWGNWNARETAGEIFRREWFEIVGAAPKLQDAVRYWDRAATSATSPNAKRASWTAGVFMGQDVRGYFDVVDVVRFQGTPGQVEETIKNVATQDGQSVRVCLEQDPGQAGVAEARYHVRNLAGYRVEVNTVREAKGIRAKPLSAQAEAGNIKVVRGAWNDSFLNELQNFDASDKCVADQVDAASGGFHMLTKAKRAGVW